MALGTRHRGPALALAILWTAVPLLAVWHAGGTQHRYCAQHEAFEDVGATRAPSAPTAATGSAPSSARPGSEPRPHELCAFARAAHPTRVDRPARRAVFLPPLVSPSLRSPASTTAPPQIALLSVAPKSSPPVSLG